VPVRRGTTGLEIDLVAVFRELISRSPGLSPEGMAASAQWALADGLAKAAVRAARERDLQIVCLSGGVACNDAIATRIRSRVESSGLAFAMNEWAPCGDGGVAFGQAVATGRGWRFLETDGADTATGEQEQPRDRR
jgi:hydrogenase maturation protein HypF